MYSRRRARSRSPHARGSSSDPPPAGVTVVREMKKSIFIGGHLDRSKTCTSEKQLPENDGYDSDYSDEMEAWADLMKGHERAREVPPGQSAQIGSLAGKGLKGQGAREAGNLMNTWDRKTEFVNKVADALNKRTEDVLDVLSEASEWAEAELAVDGATHIPFMDTFSLKRTPARSGYVKSVFGQPRLVPSAPSKNTIKMHECYIQVP